jgi:hypothetical protein
MTRVEWEHSHDGLAMLLWFRRSWSGDRSDLDRLTQRYLLACCRRIWRLLPDESSRQSVKVAERHNLGRATREEWEKAKYVAEGAYLNLQLNDGDLDQHSEGESVKRRIGEVASIPPEEVRRMARTEGSGGDYSPAKLLEAAAGFAWFSIYCYQGRGARSSMETHALIEYGAFLSAPLLRETVGNLFRPA